jgi:ATP-dependent Clp endopeptidase proteolytic subunit ClpP
MTRSWYSIRAAKDGAAAEIALMDEIGAWGIRAADFIRDLKALGPVNAITLSINSPGGEVFDGVAIYNALRRHEAKVTARIEGVAASMASVIAMAADQIVMPENSFMMIHDPAGFAVGTADDMRELADLLDKVKGSLVGAYAMKTGLPEAEIADLMAAETWMTAAEAKAKGFADRVVKPARLAACAGLARYPNAPAAVAALTAPGDPAPPLSTEESMSEQKPTAAAPAAEIDVDKLKAEAKAAAAAEMKAYVAEVTDLCALAGVPQKAGELIASGKPVAEIRRTLIDAKAARPAEPEIVGAHAAGHKPDGSANNHGWDAIMAKAAAHRLAAKH